MTGVQTCALPISESAVRFRLSFYDKISVWREYDLDLQRLPDGDQYRCTNSYFNRVWNAHYRAIELASEGGDFKKCKICSKFEVELQKHHSPALRQKLCDARKAHLELQAIERCKYYKHRRKASLEPEKYLSIIIDSMDQKKTDVPHWPGKLPGWAEGLPTYRQRVIGCKVHWRGRSFAYLFLADALISGGANLVNECLCQVLLELQKIAPLPPVLYLQFDNCAENKNKVVFGFLHHLVHQNVFCKIKVGFLMTGHTHEDIGEFAAS